MGSLFGLDFASDNSYSAIVDINIPLLTNARLAEAFINAFCCLTAGDIPIKSWDELKNE